MFQAAAPTTQTQISRSVCCSCNGEEVHTSSSCDHGHFICKEQTDIIWQIWGCCQVCVTEVASCGTCHPLRRTLQLSGWDESSRVIKMLCENSSVQSRKNSRRKPKKKILLVHNCMLTTHQMWEFLMNSLPAHWGHAKNLYGLIFRAHIPRCGYLLPT